MSAAWALRRAIGVVSLGTAGFGTASLLVHIEQAVRDEVTAPLNGTSPGTLSSSDRIFRWVNVTLRPGQNTVTVTATVTATINGSTYTDSVDWTLG